MKSVFLLPGKVCVSNQDMKVTTILGSCISVILHDTKLKISGMCHYLLPECQGSEVLNARYASYALPFILNKILELGANRDRVVAKVFGGSEILSKTTKSHSFNIGKKNIEYALNFLKKEKISIEEKDVGGCSSRKIHFFTNSSSVKVESNESENKDISGLDVHSIKKDIKVLIVDDSATVRGLFSKMFTKHQINVVGVAADAYEARQLLVEKGPDVMTLDIEMPRMNGVKFLEKVMSYAPLPVVMVSSLSSQGEAAYRALELGAVEFVHKPSQYDVSTLNYLAKTLVDKVRAASSIDVKRLGQKRFENINKNNSDRPVFHNDAIPCDQRVMHELQAIAIGGNSGSVDALEKIICHLPEDTPPLIVANSTIIPLLNSFLERLRGKTSLNLKVIQDNEFMKLGNVYFSPADFHVEVVSINSQFMLKLKDSPPVKNKRPSIDVLFSSFANTFRERGVGILLSGFGSDGVEGLGSIQKQGGLTLSIDPQDAAFPFTPQEALKHGYADKVLTADEICQSIQARREKVA